MNKYNGLLSKVANKYDIHKGTQETENDWKTRLVYSICGMMAYASLWDDSEEEFICYCAFKKKSSKYACKLQSNVPRDFG